MSDKGDVIIYQSEDGLTKIDVRLDEDTVWLTKLQLAELYQTSKSNVSEHITNIFKEGELDKDSVVRKIRTTAADVKEYNTLHYNLDMIISLGYRIHSKIAKNYLNEKELRAMGQIVSGYLDFAERQAEREIPMTMKDWAKHLDNILTMWGETS